MNNKNMSQGLYEKIYVLVREWKPDEIYDTEAKYQDALLDFLKYGLYNFDTGSGQISIKKEDGVNFCDIAINRQIGIKLELDLNKISKADRLVGQISRNKHDYPTGIIVLLLGNTEQEAYQGIVDGTSGFETVNQKFRILRNNLNDIPFVFGQLENDNSRQPDSVDSQRNSKIVEGEKKLR